MEQKTRREKGEDVKDRAPEDKEKTGGFIKEKTEAAKEKASEAPARRRLAASSYSYIYMC